MTKRKPQTYRGITFVRPEEIYDFAPTVKQIRNLLDMAYAIQNSPPPRFEMENYGSIDMGLEASSNYKTMWGTGTITDPVVLRNIAKSGHECGTACCAIGTAAFHGIGKVVDDFDEYSKESFGLRSNTNLWEFLFSSEWSHLDNTPEGAVARILYLVVEGGQPILDKFGNGYGDVYDIIGNDNDEIVNLYQKYVGVKILAK